MNTLYFLKNEDFSNSENALICTKTKELMFVLFYSTKCQYCGPAREAFNRISGQFNRTNAKFGLINITQNPRVPQLSKDTKTQIKYVPFLIAFFNETPIAVFSMTFNEPNLIGFVKKCYESISGQVDAFGTIKKEEEIPAFTIGVPYCDEGVCYLDFNAAYAAAT